MLIDRPVTAKPADAQCIPLKQEEGKTRNQLQCSSGGRDL